MSIWKELCERRDRNEAKLDMYIWKQEFDKIRAAVEEIITQRDFGYGVSYEVEKALKDLGVLP